MRVLGLDVGKKVTGLAMGDTETGIAFPCGDVSGNADMVCAHVLKQIRLEGVEAVVVGIPKASHDRSQQPFVEAFVKQLEAVCHVPIHLIDEAYTTREAKRLQQEEGSKASDHELAAMLMVEEWLSSQK